MGTDIAVPRHRGCITFVHVQPHSTLQGAVLSFLYQQHPIYASLVLSDNEKRSFRMVAGTLPDGIMISNVLSELPSIQDLWAGSTGDVRSFSLVAPPSQWAQQFDYEFSYLPIIGSNH